MRELTPRQQQIIELIAQGLENKEIGTRLGISEQMVKNYSQRIYDRLGASNRANAVYIYFVSEGGNNGSD